jgi:tetratricopeptide (TPR) repeat protein
MIHWQHWTIVFLLLQPCFLSGQKSILDDPLLALAGSSHYQPRTRTDSLVRELEAELDALDSHFRVRRQLVLNVALAYSLSSQGQYTRSTGILLRVLPRLEQRKDIPAQAFVNHWLGYNYGMMEQYRVSEYHARRALMLSTATGRLPGHSDALNGVGNALHVQDRQDSAMVYYQRSGKVAEQADYAYGVARSYSNQAAVLRLLGKQNEALHHYRRTREIAEDHSLGMLPFTLVNMGRTWLEMGKPDSALHYIQEARKVAGPRPDHSTLDKIYGDLDDVYQALGDYKNAAAAKDTVIKINQLTFTEQNFTRLAEKEAIYQNERKALEESIQAEKHLAEIREQNFLQYLISFATACVIALLLVVGVRYATHHKLRYFVVFGALLFFFEFVLVLMDSFVDGFTGGLPIPKLLANILLAALIAPLNLVLENSLLKKKQP